MSSVLATDRQLVAVAALSLAALGLALPVAASRGGPDAFGYTWRDDREPGVSYVRVDFQPPPADTFVPEPGPDASTAFLPLPFAFPFYGRSYTAVSVSEDGWLSFGEEGASDSTPSPLPDADGPDAMVAVLWEDLAVGGRGLGDFIRYQNQVGLGAFVIEWFRTSVVGSGEDATFQAWLFPDGRLRFQYLNVAGAHPDVTIGLEAENRGAGLEVVSVGAPRDGFSVRPRAVVELLPPDADADCSEPVDCGELVDDRVRGNPDDLSDYVGCGGAALHGGEVLRSFELGELTHVTAELLSGLFGDELVLLPACSDRACLGRGDRIDADFLPPGRYVLAVDALTGDSGEAFDLSLSCEPALATATCGSNPGSLGTTNRIGSWPCLGGDSAAAESLHVVSLPGGGDLLATVDRGDLQVLILERTGFPDQGARCFAAGQGRAWATDLDPGEYVVAVDGPTGATGAFTLELDCGGARTLPTGCDVTVAGALPPTGELDGWSCGGSTPGGEDLHEVRLDALATLAVTLESDESLSLLLLDGAREGPASCLARSDDGFLSFPNAPPGSYVVVVDGEAGGDYSLTIDCQEPIGSTCTPWERHDGDVPITGLNLFAAHGQVEMYELATPPPADDAGWVPAPDPVTIGYGQGSAICGHACLTALDFTYFRTFVRLPEVVTDFRVSFSTVDDGVQVRLNGEVAGHGFLGAGSTVDLTASPALRPGELNEVLLVQVDDCCSWTELSGTACVVVGSGPPCVATVAAPEDVIACPGEPVALAPASGGVENCFDLEEYRWLVDGRVVRDWSVDPRYQHFAGEAPETVTVQVRCRGDAACTAADDLQVRPPGEPVLPDVTPWLRVGLLAGRPRLDWTGATVPVSGGHFHVWRTPDGGRPFTLEEHGAVTGTSWTDSRALAGLVFYDVRAADGCERESTN